jgi:hypothetical protein
MEALAVKWKNDSPPDAERTGPREAPASLHRKRLN